MKTIFKTLRLSVCELEPLSDRSQRESLTSRIPDILSPAVVENLPPYFQHVDSPTAADQWLEVMLNDSRLFVMNFDDQVAGFLFVHLDDAEKAHIGYLLAENYWGKGLAKELLIAFVTWSKQHTNWSCLVGGVAEHNLASMNLLEKVGFHRVSVSEGTVFYQCLL